MDEYSYPNLADKIGIGICLALIGGTMYLGYSGINFNAHYVRSSEELKSINNSNVQREISGVTNLEMKINQRDY